MESAVRQMIYVAFSLAVVSVMIFTASYFTRLARDAERERMTTKALLEQQLDTREWSRYTGAQNGADMLDFILRHKDAYTIVIESTAWDVRLSPYVSGGRLTMGLGDTKNLPDYVWDKAFLYDALLRGRGDRPCTAALLTVNGAVTGIHYILGGIT